MRHRIHPGLLAIAALTGSILVFFVAPTDKARIWPGYSILLVDLRVPEKDVLSRLKLGGFSQVLSESNQPIQISNFHGLETITLAGSENRLVEGDSRRDSYLSGLRAWFRAKVDGKDFRIFYVGTGIRELTASRTDEVFATLEGSCRLPESSADRRPAWLPFAVTVAAIVLMCALAPHRRARLFDIAMGLPFLGLGAHGNNPAVAAVLSLSALAFMAPGLELSLAEYRLSGRLRPSASQLMQPALSGLAILLPPLIFILFDIRVALSCLIALLSSLFAFCAAFLLLEKARLEHGGFVPRRILRPRLSIGTLAISRSRLHFSCSILTIAGLFLALFGYWPGLQPAVKNNPASASIIVPMPQIVGGATRPEPAEALSFSRSRKDDELVDLADWLLHRWKEEAVFYSALNAGPLEPFASIAVPMPGQSGKIVKVFDKAWSTNAWRSLPPGGIEGLLLSSRAFSRARLLSFDAAYNRPLAPLQALLYIILLAPPLLGVFLQLHRGIHRRRERMQTP